METKNLTWFLLGCGLALLLAGLVLVRPLQMWADDDATPMPTSTVPAVEPTWTPRPQPTVVVDALSWQREGGLAGFCDRLMVAADGAAYYQRCDQGARLGVLTADERAMLAQYQALFASFVTETEDNPSGADSLKITLRFPGQGSQVAAAQEQAAIAAWAQAVYQRLQREELEADLVARARLALAAKLGMPPDVIETISVRATTWPDACLGVVTPGQGCAAVETPGLQIYLRVGGVLYEYRTDLMDKVRLASELGEPTPVPTQLPTATTQPTLMPSATPWPTATSQPTATPWPTTRPITVLHWRGEYYANPTLSGPPVAIRDDSAVAFDWGYGGPMAGFNADFWSARWSRRVLFSAGDYNFKLKADDGVRLWVDGVLIIDRWYGGYTEDTVKRHMGEGMHDILVEYFELEGTAQVRLTWEKFYAPKPTAPSATPDPGPVITEWRGEYYGNPDFSGAPTLVRNDLSITFDWASGPLAPYLPADQVSVRWTRSLYIGQGAFRFSIETDGDIWFSVDDQPVIRATSTGKPTLYQGDLWLTPGTHALRLEYRHRTGEARVRLGWEPITNFSGWKAEYYANRRLSGPPLRVSDEPVINFQWGNEPFGLGGTQDNFSVRWSRVVMMGASRYRFDAMADDGIRVYLDGSLIIDEWHDSSGRWYSTTRDLSAGLHQIVVEYYEHTGQASVAFGWQLLAEPTMTSTLKPTATNTAMPTSTSTATNAPTATPTPASTSTATPTPTGSQTVTPTATATGRPRPTLDPSLPFTPEPGGGRWKAHGAEPTQSFWDWLLGR